MAITTNLITGDDAETTVFAVCYDEDLTLIFRFLRDPGAPTSINSRIVNCFHDLEVDNDNESYLDRKDMRDAIQSSVSQVWHACSLHPAIHFQDVVVQIQPDSQNGIRWSICHENIFQQYVDSLRSTEDVQKSVLQGASFEVNWISLQSLRFGEILGGRGGVTIAYLREGSSSETFVYKGPRFGLFLETGRSDFQNEQAAFYHELSTLLKLPSHPNVVKPPRFLVTTEAVQKGQKDQKVCGALFPYLEGLSLQVLIEKSNTENIRLSLRSKARWAFQISRAMAAIHSSQQYHMDLKPPNILLDSQQNAVLIDWEQLGASAFLLAPEANGEYDAELVPSDSTEEAQKAKLRYMEYKGPSETRYAWPARNVFRIWAKDCPQALEAAEVFSLGRTLAIIFEQIDEELFVTSRDDFRFEPINWTASSEDIPQSWKAFVARLTSLDPNERGTFSDAAEFWRSELEAPGETLD